MSGADELFIPDIQLNNNFIAKKAEPTPIRFGLFAAQKLALAQSGLKGL